MQVCRIAIPFSHPICSFLSPIPHPSRPTQQEGAGSRDSPAFRRHVRPVRLHLLRHLCRFMMLASSFVVCRAGSVCRLPSAVPLPCCLMCVCRCMSDPSSASGAPQQNPSRACPRRASVECFSPRRAVALLLPLRVWVLSCLRVSLVCLESRVSVCLRTLHSRSRA